MEVALVRHPAAPGSAVRAVAVRVHRGRTALHLTFQIDGDLDRIRIPPPGPAVAARELWRHTCCEVFVALDGTRAYHEFNCSPSGAWTVYAFRDYRDGGPLDDVTLAPTIRSERHAGRLTLETDLPLVALSPRHRDAPLRLALSAVIEEGDGRHAYWALAHPRPTPDFHHAGGFTLRLEPAGTE